MMLQTKAILFLCGLLFCQTLSKTVSIQRNVRARHLQGYYNFDQSGGDQWNGDHGKQDDGDVNGGGGGGGSYRENQEKGSSSNSGYGDGDTYSYTSGGNEGSTQDSSYGSNSDGYGNDGGSSYGTYEGSSESGTDGDGGENSYGEPESSYGGSSDSGTSGYGGGGYDSGSAGGYDSGSTGGYHPPSTGLDWMQKVNVKVPIIPVLILGSLLMYGAMVFTAFMYQERPESVFTNCCRLSINSSKTVYKVAFNLYHGRLGEIPPILCAMDDDDDLSDSEIESMKPRAGISAALKIEHVKAMKQAQIETKTTKAPNRFANIFG